MRRPGRRRRTMRESGVLMHITSLPSPHGIGTLGRAAYEFVDFLESAGQSYWQVLPLGQTGYGNSPYQSCSAFAGNPYLIDLDLLAEEGWLTREEIEAADWGSDPENVDFQKIYDNRYAMLRLAFSRFQKKIPPEYDRFSWNEGQWLEDYALFMALQQKENGRSMLEWPEDLRLRRPEAIAAAKADLGGEMFFWKMVQYFFFRQWDHLHAYAGEHGIRIIGDIPIYAAYDSADVWSNPWCFELDENGRPIEVAGCPPDAFSDDGQLWGNPVFNWVNMRNDGYRWWVERIRQNLRFYDVIRIDHFRGFDAYYAIPYGETTARNGRWRKGPGMDLFRTLRRELGDVSLIAEDLGLLTPSVRRLLHESGYPGMKVLQFAFDGGPTNEYLPFHYDHNCVVYTGTHDNDTVKGWWSSCSPLQKIAVKELLRFTEEQDIAREMMRAAMASSADTAILTAQDLLELGTEARMNEPSTTGKNWKWRALPGAFTPQLATRLYEMTRKFDRLPKTDYGWGEDDGTPLGAFLPGQN